MTESSSKPATAAGESAAFIFDKMHRVIKRRMPTLELIHERFARTARLALYNMVRRSVEVDVMMPELKPYAAFVGAFPERTNINLVNIRPVERGVMSPSFRKRIEAAAASDNFLLD